MWIHLRKNATVFKVFWFRFQDEIEEMMAAAVDIHSGDIHYEYYINSLMVRHVQIYAFFSEI